MTFALLGALALIPTSGCVVQNETTPTASPPSFKFPDETSFCAAVAATECNSTVVTACFDTNTTANTQKCVADRASPAVCNPLGLSYHANDAANTACLAAYTSVYAGGSWTRAQLDGITKACLTTFSKGGGTNAPCAADTDCDAIHGLSCVIHASGGSCQVPNMVNGGDKCANQADKCPDKDYCDATNHCIAVASAGEACAAGIPCDSASRCDLTKMPSVCAAGLADQSPCTTDDECAGTFCYKATGSTSGKCLSIYKLDSLSANCDPFTK